jgi:hypothetical protein
VVFFPGSFITALPDKVISIFPEDWLNLINCCLSVFTTFPAYQGYVVVTNTETSLVPDSTLIDVSSPLLLIRYSPASYSTCPLCV